MLRRLLPGCGKSDHGPHKFVNRIIILPNFGQGRVNVDCDTPSVASGPGLISDTGFLSPPAPRGLDRIGPDLSCVVQSVSVVLGRRKLAHSFGAR